MGIPAAYISPTALREASTSFARNRKSAEVLLARLSARPLFPEFLEILRDVFQVRITGAVG